MPLFINYSAIWRLNHRDLADTAVALVETHGEKIWLAYANGPTLAWGEQIGKTIRQRLCGLNDTQIAKTHRMNSSHVSAILNGRRPLTMQLLLALMEQVWLHEQTLSAQGQPIFGLNQLPTPPTGAAYHRYAWTNAMKTIAAILKEQEAAERGELYSIPSRQRLAYWEFELLDILLTDHVDQWQHCCRERTDLEIVLRNDPRLQDLIRACTKEASQRSCLSTHDQDCLVALAAETSPTYEAFRRMVLLFNEWHATWKMTKQCLQRLKRQSCP